jgi:hypothetical protein
MPRKTISRARRRPWGTGPAQRGVAAVCRSDPLRFEFDSKLYIQEFIKTQFAGPAIHAQVMQLLRTLEPHFETLSVEDEGELWSGGDVDVLQGHLSAVERALVEHLQQNPGAQGPVRLESGRWVDFIS